MKHWIHAMRLRTLPAAGAPLILGGVLAYLDRGLHWGIMLCAVVSALAIQIGTNLANDYFDWKNGADTELRVGPVRVTQAGLIPPHHVWWAMVACFGIAALAGSVLMVRCGWPIVGIGLVSIAMGILYTGGPRPLGYMGLGDGLVFVFFGPVATAGTYYVNVLQWNLTALVLGSALGVMATAIIVVNNLRDIDEDRTTGKTTLAVRFGATFARWEYTFCMAGGCFLAGGWAVANGRGWSAVAAGMVGAVAIRLMRQVWKLDGRALDPLLGQTGRLLLALSLGLSLGWVLG